MSAASSPSAVTPTKFPIALPILSRLLSHSRSASAGATPLDSPKSASSFVFDRTTKILLQHLPAEILWRVFSWLDNPDKFSKSCKSFHSVSREPIPTRDLFFHRYGVKASLVNVFFRRNQQCTPEIARMLLRGGALAPRYFIQYVFNLFQLVDGSSIAPTDPNAAGRKLKLPTSSSTASTVLPARMMVGSVSSPPRWVRMPWSEERQFEFCFELLQAGIQSYGNDLTWIQENDVETFERLSNNLTENLELVNRLVFDYHFIPLEEISHAGTFRIYQMARFHMPLLQHMIDKNGLDLRRRNTNDLIMHWVLTTNSMDAKEFRRYLDLGFFVSEKLLVELLTARITPEMIRLLRSTVSEDVLQKHAINALTNMAGPSGTFAPEIATHLVRSFGLGPPLLDKVFLNQLPGNPCETRCYEAEHPEYVWTWLLKTFPARHRYVQAAFRDATAFIGDLSDRVQMYRNPADLPWQLPLAFLDAGCKFGPLHLRSIAKAARSEWACPAPTVMLRKIAEWVREQNQIAATAKLRARQASLSVAGKREEVHAHDDFEVHKSHARDGNYGLALEKFATTGSIVEGSRKSNGGAEMRRDVLLKPVGVPSKSKTANKKPSLPLLVVVPAQPADRTGPASPTSPVVPYVLTDSRRLDWITALRREITRNRELIRAIERAESMWKHGSGAHRRGNVRQSVDASSWSNESPMRFVSEAENLIQLLKTVPGSIMTYAAASTEEEEEGRTTRRGSAGSEKGRRKSGFEAWIAGRSRSRGRSPSGRVADAAEKWNRFVETVVGR
ncbi:hypothetical protein BJ742DRAFT_165918 [Cladochytrium replicatum]|nr:hypothetical protein BJ742DRAFT_165918 [Cladochytrium replicatum]